MKSSRRALASIQEVIPELERKFQYLCHEIREKLEAVNDRSVSWVLEKATVIGLESLSEHKSFEGDGDVDDIQDRLLLVKEFCWEQLNVGHWKLVPQVWRVVYSYVALLKVIFLLREGDENVRDAIKECDLGLLLGEPIFENALSKVAFRLHRLSAPISIEENLIRGERRKNIDVKREVYHKQACSILKFHYDGRFDVELVTRPTIEYFVEEFFHREKPVLMLEILQHWPAMSKWSVEYIRKKAGSRTVPIEIGSKYTCEEWTQALVTMDTFIQDYVEKSEECSTKKGYLAQHQLFHQIPELMEDIEIPEYCFVGSSPNVEINAWFGPAGTISPTHYDEKHNLLAQVFGSKIVRLFHSEDWNLLYPFEGKMLFNTSQIDVEDPELPSKFPATVKAKYTDVLLGPGTVLYIPPKWAHYVKSLSPSFSISFWFK